MLIASTASNLGIPRFRHVTASFLSIKPKSVGLPRQPSSCRIVGARTSEEDPVTTVDFAVDLQAKRIESRIRRSQLAQGLTLVQLAASADLSHPFVSQLERGRARPSSPTS